MSSASPPSSCVGLIGLGLLGSALADAMEKGGFRVMGWDRDPSRCRDASTAEDVFDFCDRVLFCLPTYADSRAVLADAELHKGQMIVDVSTGSPKEAEELGALLAEHGVHYADATVSGSSAQAARRELLVMAGGDATVIDACRDAFDCFAADVAHVGPVGSGARMKLVTNLVLGLNRAALAEGLAFAQALGLDGATTLDVMRRSMAYSRIMDTKGEKMVRRDFTPQAKVSQHLKDVRLMLEETNLKLPLCEAHRALLEEVVALGFGDLDNSALICAYDTGRKAAE
jgi:3-hydroxyisobutyrate dehydrogenase-like beta-hydroxyacid dehydrogenase